MSSKERSEDSPTPQQAEADRPRDHAQDLGEARSPEQLAEYFKAFLETLAPLEWLQRAAQLYVDHPLVRYWQTCALWMESKGRVQFGGPRDEAIPLAKTLLYSWHVWCLERSVGPDNPLFRRLRLVAQDARQFSDTMVEVSAATWCLLGGFRVSAHEDPGMPEFAVDMPPLMQPLHVECKRPATFASAKRIRQHLYRANRKWKRLPDAVPGILIMDVTSLVDSVAEKPDETPPDVVRIRDDIKRAFEEPSFRSISAVGLVWVDFGWTPLIRSRPWRSMAIRMRSDWLDHPAARSVLPADLPIRKFGFTSLFDVSRPLASNRLAPCYCGSGLRFKHCHGKLY